ncbi:MAG TPA: sulfite exporter TauE/SafE family protein [Gemmatimonadales bacterium]|nr:sulfite exporter TauE/SafE family protein [Gemmatimonadales bacterium]
MPGPGDLWHLVVAFFAGLGGGAMNALAGGGTNLSFPALVWLGLPAIQANATSAVALWPGSAAGAWGFRKEAEQARRWWFWLLVPSLIGGAVGAYLLIHTPPQFFKSLAPWLVIASSALIAAEPAITRRLDPKGHGHRSNTWRVVALAVQLLVAVYGGYFGAGLGILILTALGFLGLSDIRQANALKNLFSLAIKGVAVIYFIIVAEVSWTPAVIMAVGAVIGGYAAARLGRKLAESTMRWVVTGIGVAVGIAMLVKLAD